MKSLLAGIGLPKAIGLYINEGTVHLSQVVSTPWGPVEVARDSHTASPAAGGTASPAAGGTASPAAGGTADPDQLASVLERLLAPRLGRRGLRTVPVAIGLPAGLTYFSTRAIQSAGSDVSPHVLLREALRSSNISVDEMVVDVIKTQPDKRLVASIVSCDRKYLTGLLDSLQECGVRPHRAEPAPCALLRAGSSRHRAGRNAKVLLRLFLGEKQALAVLAAKDLPLVWRSFSLPRGDEASALLSVSRSLQTMSRLCGVESPLDGVILHGRPDLSRLLDVDWVQQEMGAEVKWFDGPALDDSQVAFGLALGCLGNNQTAFDLSRSLKPRASLREVFPFREAVLQAALLLCMALLLLARSGSLTSSRQAVAAENARRPWMAAMQTVQLENEKNQLLQRVAAVQKFVDTRVTWSYHARELAGSLPANVFLTSFQGVSELGSGGKKRAVAKPKKSLVLHGAAFVPPDGSIPHEIDRFLDLVREHPAIRRDFPVVELADLKQSQLVGDNAAIAFFTVVCVPKGGQATGRR